MILSTRFTKKGFFFTVLAIIIVAIFALVFSVKPYSPEESQQAIESRVILVNSFTRELKNTYLERVLRSTAKATLNAMTDYIRTTGHRFDNANDAFSSIITSGTLPNFSKLDSMNGKSLNNFTQKISQLSTDKFKINTQLKLSGVTVAHKDAWTLNISANASIVTQRLDTTFNLTTRISTLLPIEGLENPLYAQYNFTSAINRTNISQWNFGTMQQFLASKHYRLNADAPSFFMRFNKSYGRSPYGIESLVNIPLNYLGKNSGEHNYSRADWQFFYNPDGKCPPLTLYTFDNIQGTEEFLLDTSHIASFGVNGTTYTLACPLGGP